jgi:hypothetical protein
MKTFNKKEIRTSVHEALTQVVGSFEIQKPSKKTAKLIEKTSKKISRELRDELKKQLRKMEKAGNAVGTKKLKKDSVAA